MNVVEGSWELPKIKTGPPNVDYYHMLFDMGKCGGVYGEVENTIFLMSAVDYSKHDWTRTLVHEVNHWAHLYLVLMFCSPSSKVVDDILEPLANYGLEDDDV